MAAAAHPSAPPLLADYLGYAATFVGAGLISGAIVHHPLDPARYTVIAVVGAGVFLFATVLNEFVLTKQRPDVSRVLAIVGASLALSFGIGMLGGLQHFEDFPERAAMLIPFGQALSFIAYVLRYQPARWRSIVGPAGVLVLVTAAGGLRRPARNRRGHGRRVGKRRTQPRRGDDRGTGGGAQRSRTGPRGEAGQPDADLRVLQDRRPRRIRGSRAHRGRP
ncbi:hypothetical protein QF037_009371 [Streptomyces canus]|uniref:hypothetical protein n=1 Tax=Streptomyces canus TaxID=58343 RepID=UPI00277DF3C8|nr:hypothetical protein [Streptomyces canus]MDQ0605026.1 hypothetical protein [Streptomyces canus]